MRPFTKLLDTVRGTVRSLMHRLARELNRLSKGRLQPNTITVAGLLAHIPIAWLISLEYTLLSGILLIFFGLFDTLDGELARLQKTSSPAGMFIDSSTDRIKEIFLYCGITALLFDNGDKYLLVAVTAALGASLATSYLNAWGEAVLANSGDTHKHESNKTFRSGFLGFDIRMFLLIVGLLLNRLEVVIYTILILAIITVFQRFFNITGRLKRVQD